MSAEPSHVEPKKQIDLSKYVATYPTLTSQYAAANATSRDPSGAEKKEVTTFNATLQLKSDKLIAFQGNDDVATAILRKKKKPNSLM